MFTENYHTIWMELDISWPHICAEMGNALHFCLFIFSYDFENLNVVECQVTDRFFVFVAEPPKMPGKMHSSFSHRPKNESCQNQKQKRSNKRSYQKMKKKKKPHKNTHVKKLHPEELFSFKNIKDQGVVTIKKLWFLFFYLRLIFLSFLIIY